MKMIAEDEVDVNSSKEKSEVIYRELVHMDIILYDFI